MNLLGHILEVVKMSFRIWLLVRVWRVWYADRNIDKQWLRETLMLVAISI